MMAVLPSILFLPRLKGPVCKLNGDAAVAVAILILFVVTLTNGAGKPELRHVVFINIRDEGYLARFVHEAVLVKVYFGNAVAENHNGQRVLTVSAVSIVCLG